MRALGLPTITDRVAQTAAALVLQDRVAALFSDRSFAYRPFLGPRRAAVFLRTCLAGAAYVVTADIEKFFDNVEHRILADQLRNIGVDDAGVQLIVKWLLAPVDDRGRWYQPVKGLPQGSPIAPVLANLYLTGYDSALEAEGFAHVRYADDVVLSSTVIEECVRRRIAVAFCRVSGKPIARLVPARSPLDTAVVQRQLRARAGTSGTALAQAVLVAKLANQRALLRYHSKYRGRDGSVRKRLIESAGAIELYIREIERASGPLRMVRQRLFLAEARAAAHYWEAVGALAPAALGFRRRVHRGANDVVNKALNYGYSQLLGRVWIAVHRAGLEPSLGLLHTGRRRSAGLVFDLMEPSVNLSSTKRFSV